MDQQAAEKLQVSGAYIRLLASSGRIKATKYGSSWLIDPKGLKLPKPLAVGRPKNKSVAGKK